MPCCRNVNQTFQVLLQEGGMRGMWRGTGPTVVRLAVGASINFVALENLKHFMLDVLPQASGQLGYLQAAAVGGKLAPAVQDDTDILHQKFAQQAGSNDTHSWS